MKKRNFFYAITVLLFSIAICSYFICRTDWGLKQRYRFHEDYFSKLAENTDKLSVFNLEKFILTFSNSWEYPSSFVILPEKEMIFKTYYFENNRMAKVRNNFFLEKSDLSSEVVTHLKGMLTDFKKSGYHKVTISDSDKILVFIDDSDMCYFYPINMNPKHKFSFSCTSSITLQELNDNDKEKTLPYSFSLGNGWYVVRFLECPGIS